MTFCDRFQEDLEVGSGWGFQGVNRIKDTGRNKAWLFRQDALRAHENYVGWEVRKWVNKKKQLAYFFSPNCPQPEPNERGGGERGEKTEEMERGPGAMGIKMVWHWPKKQNRMQLWNRPTWWRLIYIWLRFLISQWRIGGLFNKRCWNNWILMWKIMRFDPYLTPYAKINMRQIINLS